MDIEKIEKLTKEECSKYINLGLDRVTREPELAHTEGDVCIRTPKIYCFSFTFFDIESRTELPIIVRYNLEAVRHYEYRTEDIETAFKHCLIELLHRVNRYIEENYKQRIVLKSEIRMTQECDILDKLKYITDMFEYNENEKALTMINNIYRSVKSL